LALLSIFGGVVQIPGVSDVISKFLEPTFADSPFADFDVSSGNEALALIVGAVTSLIGIGIAWVLWMERPGITVDLVRRLPRLHIFLQHKWYFDELYEFAIVRPLRALGNWTSNVFERVVVQGMVGTTETAVRAGNSLVRVVQTGVLRYYALLLMIGVGGLALYFLVVSS
jgi:NADH-quinone oxidoreductase subunit L